LILHLSWILMTVLRFAGVAVVFSGVALFGGYFIRGNGRSQNGSVPRASWWGPGPRKGMLIVAGGLVLLAAAFLISLFMPDGS
jgi:hypothetical protein